MEENVLVEVTETVPLSDVKYYSLPDSQRLKIDFIKSLFEKGQFWFQIGRKCCLESVF